MTDDRWQLVDALLARLDDEQTDAMTDALARLRSIDPARLTASQRAELAQAIAGLRAAIDAELAETTRVLAGRDASLADWLARSQDAGGQLRDDARDRCDEIIAQQTADEALRHELDAQRAILDAIAARVAAVSDDTEPRSK